MSFEQVQQEFMAHIRNPDAVTGIDNIEDRRLKVYRELFFNNIKGFLSNGFPVTASLFEEQEWNYIARQFFINHDCRSPYFIDISKEYVEYLANEVAAEDYPFPFMAELVHYEWLELDVSARKSEKLKLWDGASAIQSFAFSPAAELVSYTWPVHQISPDFIPDEPLEQPNFYVVYRREDFDVNFTQVNQVTAHLINCVINLESDNADKVNLNDITEIMLQALPQLPGEQVVKATHDIVTQMLQSQIFVLA